ncbi:MAG: DivIVA domain-containing protein, partial [Acidimicrobiales bacterium]
MEEPQISISSSRNPDPDSIASREFPTVRRGYDPAVVKRFLSDIAQHLRSQRAREADLVSRLTDAEHRAQSPSFDEETLSAAVGSETARILHAAHAAGAEVLAKAESRATEIVSGAEAVAREIRGRAETEASTIIGDARQTAANALEAARSDGRAMVEEAREVRRKILGDLTERRRSLAAQIDQLQAGKDSLYSAVAHVADAIADVRARLVASDEEARAAADLARRRTEIDHPEIEKPAEPVPEPEALGSEDMPSPVAATIEKPVPKEGATASPPPPAPAVRPGENTEG